MFDVGCSHDSWTVAKLAKWRSPNWHSRRRGEILNFERGVSDSELGKTGEALPGMAEGNFGLNEGLRARLLHNSNLKSNQ